MVDPENITDYDRSEEELEELLLFCVSVAGHNAMTTARHLDAFLKDCRLKYGCQAPFDCVRACIQNANLAEELRSFGLGRYNLLSRSFTEIIESDLDLSVCSRNDLTKIFGIGLKTASYFLLHSRENMDIACLDIHILRFLKGLGHDVPLQSPTGNRYHKIEQTFLLEAQKRRVSASVLDLSIWNASHVRA